MNFLISCSSKNQTELTYSIFASPTKRFHCPHVPCTTAAKKLEFQIAGHKITENAII